MTQNTTRKIPAGLDFPETSQLTELQQHVAKLCDHFGWHNTPERMFLLLTEEVGELAKAIRNKEKLFQEQPQEQAKAPDDKTQDNKVQAAQDNLAEELADVFSYLMDIANAYDVDLGQAYVKKMSANFGRVWE